jgi:N6-L-threonylcarbamoyladenine synthase/protein kinase Bud32
MYTPREGGIHPREAADHHVKVGSDVVQKALDDAGIEERELDLVSFSKGPGLGPCLRIGATMARVLSLKNDIPIIGANHCVAHLEIGSILGAQEPVLLYTSGGNTQIIAYVKGRYRVLGETLDIGIGNMLDKLGRELGISFPAGPKIEKLAKGENVLGLLDEGSNNEPELIELPYSVKGMDMSFSGIMTAALAHWRNDASLPSICYSVQETCYSMLCEVTERAMAHIGSDEVLLGGGVACNSRLKEMVETMARERGGKSFAPPPDLAVDNGSMIAYLGEKMYQAGLVHNLPDTTIDQRFRTDMVDVTWKQEKEISTILTPGTINPDIGENIEEKAILGRGAEAKVTTSMFGDIPSVKKVRYPKGYRTAEMDRNITTSRIKNEARILRGIRSLGIRTPYILDIDIEGRMLTMELLKGPRLASLLNVLPPEKQKESLREMGRITGAIHNGNIVHGDLTTSNFIILKKDPIMELGLIDCSLGERTEEVEKKGVDLRLFFEVLYSTHGSLEKFENDFHEGYSETNSGWAEVRSKLREITKRGRYLMEKWAK